MVIRFRSEKHRSTVAKVVKELVITVYLLKCLIIF